jgi:hypothetical protein
MVIAAAPPPPVTTPAKVQNVEKCATGPLRSGCIAHPDMTANKIVADMILNKLFFMVSFSCVLWSSSLHDQEAKPKG